MAGELQAIHDYESDRRGHEEYIDQRDIGISSDEKIQWEQAVEGLKIRTPFRAPTDRLLFLKLN